MLGFLQEQILLILASMRRSCTVNDIQSKLSRDTGKNQSFGSVFTTLDRLTDKGFVSWEKGEQNPKHGGRSPRIYTITLSGRKCLIDSIEQRKKKYTDLSIEDILSAAT